MPAPQTASRQEDEITHSDALFGAVEGILVGLAVGALVGAAIVATGGLAVVAVGAVLVGGGVGGMFGKTIGRHSTHPKGNVLTGSADVFIGFDKRPAARAWADVAHCDDHSDSEPAHDQPGILGKRIAQGSATVLINGFHAAREGGKGSCDFTLGEGWPTVFIGGPTATVGKIDSEVPAFVDDLISGMAIVGTALIMWPAAVAMFSAGTAAGLGGGVVGVGANLAQVGLRLAAQVYVGTKLSEAGGAVGHGVAGFFGAKDGSLASDLATLTGQTAAPFAGGRIYRGIAEAPLPGMEAPSGISTGPSGARPSFESMPEEQNWADSAYDRIRADNGDVARIAQNTGYPEEHIAGVKQHLFYDEHDLQIPSYDASQPEIVRQRFVPDPNVAYLWSKAGSGTLGEPDLYPSGNVKPNSADPLEVSNFHDLIAHEYVEQGLMSDGLPYRSVESWGQGKSGWNFYPDGESAGAHDLAPLAGPDGKDPFSHYESMGRSSDGIPRPNEDLSNLNETLKGVRRNRGPIDNGPSGGGGPADGSEGGAGGSPGGRSAPRPKPFVPARPLPATTVEGIKAVPPGDAAPVSVADAAPEAADAAAPLPEAQAAQAEPEPPPVAAAPDPAARPDFTGKLRGQDSTLPGVKTQSIFYTKRPRADAKALRDLFNSKAEYDPSTKAPNPRPLVENRSNFLKELAKDPDKAAALKEAGLTQDNIDLMKDGGCPQGWQVHHKLPLDDGGTNAPDNLVLMKNDPYHLTVTSTQATLTKGMMPGDAKTLDWPIPPGFVYPP